jgi:hypothetical protein
VNPLDIDGSPLLAWRGWAGAFGVLGAAYLLGALATIWTAPSRRTDAMLLRLCAGLAILPVFVLWVGQISTLLFALPWWVSGVAGGVWLLRDSALLLGSGFFPISYGPRAIGVLTAAGWLAAGSTLVILAAPSVAPPMNYDVLEYHLGVVPHYFEVGRILPIPHVFYSAQPLGTEMLYTLAHVIEGTLLLMLASGLLCRALLLLGAPTSSIPALALIFLAHPIMFRLELDRLTDLTGGVFFLAGVVALVEPSTRSSASRADLRCFWAGFFAGAAVATKWTNAGTAALSLFALILMSRAPNQPAFRGVAGRIAWFLVGAAPPLAPWMIWLGVRAGNPFAPFLAGIFPTELWDAERLAWLLETHDPVSPISISYWGNLLRRLAPLSFGPPLVTAILGFAAIQWLLKKREASPPVSFRSGAEGAAAFLAIGVFASILLWGRLAQAAERFLAPVILAELLALGILAGGIVRRSGPRVEAWIAIGLLLLAMPYWTRHLSLIKTARFWAHATGRMSAHDFTRQDWALGDVVDLFDEANRLPPGSRTLAIGEARRYYLRRPSTLASVFDLHPIYEEIRASTSAEELRIRLVEKGYTHLLVNEDETARLLHFHPPPPLDDDIEFQRLRAAGRGSYPALAEWYWGYAEFGTTPLTKDQRRIYGEFLGWMRRRAGYFSSAGSLYPARWISDLHGGTARRAHAFASGGREADTGFGDALR